MSLTRKIRGPIGVAVSSRYDGVVNMVVVQVVKDTIPVGTVAIPGVLKNDSWVVEFTTFVNSPGTYEVDY